VGYLRDKEGLIAFGKRIKEVRKEKRFSQEELAYATGLALSQIGRMERGEINVGLSTVFIIARILNVELSYLFDFTLPSLDINQFTK
jgi:transcriptional regulator with XRE-family HTH domain